MKTGIILFSSLFLGLTAQAMYDSPSTGPVHYKMPRDLTCLNLHYKYMSSKMEDAHKRIVEDAHKRLVTERKLLALVLLQEQNKPQQPTTNNNLFSVPSPQNKK
jgi:hypothetical protein